VASHQVAPVEAAQVRPNRANGGRFTRNPTSQQIMLTVKIRKQTPTEARLFSAAFELLVGEIIRHEWGRSREKG